MVLDGVPDAEVVPDAPETEAAPEAVPEPEAAVAAGWVRSKHPGSRFPMHTLGDMSVTYATAKSPYVLTRAGVAVGEYWKLADAMAAAVQEGL